MSTAANIYTAFGIEVGDPANSLIPTQRLELWLNRVVKEAVERTNSIWDVVTISGLYDIEILTYTALTGNTITLQTSEDTASTTYIIDSATSNSNMATEIAVQLDAHANVTAYASGAHVYVCVVGGGTISSLTTNETDATAITLTNGAEFFNLATLITNFRRIEEVYSVDDDVHYKPCGYQEYMRCLLDSAFDGYVYAIPVEAGSYMLYLKANGGNLLSSNTVTISHLLWPTSITSAATEMPGILSHHDDLVVKGMLYYYYNQKGQFEIAAAMRQMFERWCRQAKKEIRMQGKPQEMSHFLRVAND